MEEDVTYTISATQDQTLFQDSGEEHIVRRLTPLECERLMGFPDGFTNIPYKGKDNAPDTPRYKALGNSIAVPCLMWLGRRIEAFDVLHADEVGSKEHQNG